MPQRHCCCHPDTLQNAKARHGNCASETPQIAATLQSRSDYRATVCAYCAAAPIRSPVSHLLFSSFATVGSLRSWLRWCGIYGTTSLTIACKSCLLDHTIIAVEIALSVTGRGPAHAIPTTFPRLLHKTMRASFLFLCLFGLRSRFRNANLTSRWTQLHSAPPCCCLLSCRPEM